VAVRPQQLHALRSRQDIGGGYAENESRLSDIALEWMAQQAKTRPHPIETNPFYLQLSASPDGTQHDECKVGVSLLVLFHYDWRVGHRNVDHDASVDQSIMRDSSSIVSSSTTKWAAIVRRYYVLTTLFRTIIRAFRSARAIAQHADMRGLEPLPNWHTRFKLRWQNVKNRLWGIELSGVGLQLVHSNGMPKLAGRPNLYMVFPPRMM
jgi:hypothetical protein